jgi:hypothetical protein
VIRGPYLLQHGILPQIISTRIEHRGNTRHPHGNRPAQCKLGYRTALHHQSTLYLGTLLCNTAGRSDQNKAPQNRLPPAIRGHFRCAGQSASCGRNWSTSALARPSAVPSQMSVAGHLRLLQLMTVSKPRFPVALAVESMQFTSLFLRKLRLPVTACRH